MLTQKSDYEFVDVSGIDIQGKILPVAPALSGVRLEDVAYLCEMCKMFSKGVAPSQSAIPSVAIGLKTGIFDTLRKYANGDSGCITDKLVADVPDYQFPVRTSNYPYDVQEILEGQGYGFPYASVGAINHYTGIRKSDIIALYNPFNRKWMMQMGIGSGATQGKWTARISGSHTFPFKHYVAYTDEQHHTRIRAVDISEDVSSYVDTNNKVMYHYGSTSYYVFNVYSERIYDDTASIDRYFTYLNGAVGDINLVFDLKREDVEKAYAYLSYHGTIRNSGSTQEKYQHKRVSLQKVSGSLWTLPYLNLSGFKQWMTDNCGFDESVVGTFSDSQKTQFYGDIVISYLYCQYNHKCYFQPS